MYDDPIAYTPMIRESDSPLTLREVILTIDAISQDHISTSIPKGILQRMLKDCVTGSTPEARRACVDDMYLPVLNAPYYPELGEWYASVTEHFIETGDIVYLTEIEDRKGR